MIKCECGQLYNEPKIWPIRCFCGRNMTEDGDIQRIEFIKRPPVELSSVRNRKKPKTFGSILYEMIGCGCQSLPWREWDNNSLEWCRDNIDIIVEKIASEPNTRLSHTEGYEKVLLAIKIAERFLVKEEKITEKGPITA